MFAGHLRWATPCSERGCSGVALSSLWEKVGSSLHFAVAPIASLTFHMSFWILALDVVLGLLLFGRTLTWLEI